MIDINLILTIHGYIVALIFLITVYFWVQCKNRGIIDIYKRPLTVGLILALGIPLLLGSVHYFFSEEISLYVKYSLFFFLSLVLFLFNILNYKKNFKNARQESKEFFNMGKNCLVKPLPPNKERIKQQLIDHFIKPKLEELAAIKRENQREYKISLGKIKDEEEKIKDKFEDLLERGEELDKKEKKLEEIDEQLKLDKGETRFNSDEVKKEAESFAKKETGYNRKKAIKASQKIKDKWYDSHEHHVKKYFTGMPSGWYKSSEEDIKDILKDTREL